MFRDVSFEVHGGEIVGLAGLVGSGRSEVARAIYGLYPVTAGTMVLNGRSWRPRAPHQGLAAGLVYLPEERKRQGLVLDHSVRDSISIGFSDLLTHFGLLPHRQERRRVARAMDRYAIRASSPDQSVGTLSGGNQQKSLLARWLEREPSVLLLDEPTRGVDVGAKAQIHATIDRLAADGKAVLLISSDLHEVLGMCDRVLVMNRGRISANLAGAERTEHNVILASSGMYQASDASPPADAADPPVDCP
jgi:rhamnose transport system ATP-binding protein